MPDCRGAEAPPDLPGLPVPTMRALLAAGEAARALSTPPADRDRADDAPEATGDAGTAGGDGRSSDQRDAA